MHIQHRYIVMVSRGTTVPLLTLLFSASGLGQVGSVTQGHKRGGGSFVHPMCLVPRAHGPWLWAQRAPIPLSFSGRQVH